MLQHLAASNCLCKHCHSNQQCHCLVTCPNNCGQDVLQSEMDEHKRQCPLELVECENQCGTKKVQCDSHTKLLLIVLCVLTAILTIVMIKMQRHRQLQCDNVNNIKSGDPSVPSLQETKSWGSAPLRETKDKLTSNDNNRDLKSKSFDEHDYQILPVVLIMKEFTDKRIWKKLWYNDPFLVSMDGCPMCLQVDANGYNTLRDTFVSVYLYLIDFHHSNCNWPLLSGKFVVELFNQFSDNVYHRQKMKIANNPDNGKILNKNLSFSGWGYYNFISHYEIKFMNTSVQEMISFTFVYFMRIFQKLWYVYQHYRYYWIIL